MSAPSSVRTSSLSETLPTSRPSVFRRWVLGALAGMTRGALRLELPDGSAQVLGDPASGEPVARIRVHREAFFARCFWSGDIGFAESYLDGEWDSPDLTAVIAFFVRNVESAPTLSGSRRAAPAALNLLRFANRIGHLLRPNTRVMARRNIREHYDLSNEFFALWLDPSMMYSSARWPAHGQHWSLEEAQREKNDALCRHLRLRPDDHVLEIGTGWGGWALHAASTYGCRVTTITISREQHDLARRRVAEAGLAERVEVQLRDFRDLSGRYDKVVSIEMLEALGHRYQATFAEVVARVLKPDGLLAMQFITCPDARYGEFRRGVDFIQKHVFPGSLLLSLNRMNDLLSRSGGFVVHAVEDFGPDYARTLRLWREKFHARLGEVRQLGFDERFLRKWHYYLCYCEAAFALRNISVVHTLHTRANNPALG
ncbi:MAG: class I SAM-dependent methyltransferase [Verrucomicrobia bacterium]|nr:class I SAM-dependent methyltransferase [Verrucomicrobiota bacterium]